MPHVTAISFHGCPDLKHRAVWSKQINRKDGRWKGVNGSTKVCSNHFVLGRPFPGTPHPTLYMKGYPVNDVPKRPAPRERASTTIIKRKRIATSMASEPSDHDEVNICDQDDPTPTSDPRDEHNYSGSCQEVCDKCSPLVQHLISTIQSMEVHINNLMKIQEATSVVPSTTPVSRAPAPSTRTAPATLARPAPAPLTTSVHQFSIDHIKEDPSLMQLHTGIQNYDIFCWVLEEVSFGAHNMHYYRSSGSQTTKRYQVEDQRKPGKGRSTSAENELLLTLMRLKLDLLDEHLAFLFRISVSKVSQIISTWIPLLSKELSGLIYWPPQEIIKEAYPSCFNKFETVRAIIDCTEIGVQKPSLASTNSKIFSSYKNKPTAKFLLACSPNGNICFISEPAGGRMSDRMITESSGICNLFEPGDVCMADRGFNIEDLLLPQGARLVMPPFTRKGKQFNQKKAEKTKTVSSSICKIKEICIINKFTPLQHRTFI